jgi:transglutaminase-like putative cysteine protease
MVHKILALFLSMFACICQNAWSAPTPLDLAQRYGTYHTQYVLNADGSGTETHEWSMTVLKQQAIEWAKRASFSYSTSVQTAEIVEAYTKKADGKRIDVPKDNYQLNINKGREQDAPVFSDRNSASVVFPDVAVGDTVVFSYRIKHLEPIFPGHFSVSENFSTQIAYDDVLVEIDYPSSLWVQFSSRDVKETVSEAGGRKKVAWSFSNPQPVKSLRENYSAFDPDKERGYAFSTFKSYGDIADAYGKRALPKAAVTDRVQTLANEIAGGKASKREEAAALYEWVATKITYAGNCVGIGAVVPHDIPFILDNKMGDCKDHATLLQALLAARGIQSLQALVNAGSTYTLPKVPVVANINHVFNYIPAFDLYVDSTSNSTPFGMLPAQDRGKPVLHVGQYKEGTKTPVPAMASSQVTRSALKVLPDGSVSGSVDVSMSGDAASGAREWARNLTKDAEADFVKMFFRSMNINGAGKLVKDDATGLAGDYHLKLVIDKAERLVKLPGSGAFYLYPLLGGSVQQMVASPLEEEEKTDFACSNGSVVEEYEIQFPKNMKILSVPDNFKASNRFQKYDAHYALKSGVLKAKRSFIDNTPYVVCAPEIGEEYRKLGEKVADNLKVPVLYK